LDECSPRVVGMAHSQDRESLLPQLDFDDVNQQHRVNRRRRQRGLAINGAAACGILAVLVLLGYGPHVRQSEESASLGETSVAAEVETCSAAGENCATSRCCSTPGFTCYKKNEFWSECRESCIPGPDPRSPDNAAWTCDKLGKPADGDAPKCSKNGENCLKTGCCEASGMQCFHKADGWATCKVDCEPGIDLTDVDATPWTCKPLGRRTPDVADWVWSKCSATGGDCTKSQCCNEVGMQCFMKDQYYGNCRKSCDPSDPETMQWSCEARGYRLPEPAPKPSSAEGKPAPWVADYCAKDGEECSDSKCCAQPGHRCYEKNANATGCKSSCVPGSPDLYDEDNEEWSCKELGPRTPGVPLEPWEAQKHVSEWVHEKCAEQFSENCYDSRCCKTPGDRCHAKNDGWAACMPDCVPGPREGDDSGGNWTCKALGPRTHRAYPSLYCFSVLQPFGYEPGLMKAQIPTGHGIWACDHFSAFSVKEIVIGEVAGYGEVKTHTFVPAEVGRSKDYTAANAELFMHVWDAVGKLGLWKKADWTVKVDPDAVLLPTRLRKHLDAFAGQNGYVVNCAKPFMPEGPMMFGALETFAHSALEAYFEKAGDCAGSLPWHIWGEDLYMGKCLEKIGVKRLNDFSIYSDGVCRGVDCADPEAAAFHPMKDVGSWMNCLAQTSHPHPKLTTNAPQWFKDYMKSYAGV